MGALILIIVLGTSIWVAFDANAIGVEKGQLEGVADMGPAGWFFVCLLFWIVGFPLYLAKRGELKRINAEIAEGGTPVSQGATQTSYLDELEKLAHLREKGILTEHEFQTQKAKLLGLPIPSSSPPPIPSLQPKPQPEHTPISVADERTVNCPLCRESLLLRTLRVGNNTCPHCQEIFKAE